MVPGTMVSNRLATGQAGKEKDVVTVSKNYRSANVSRNSISMTRSNGMRDTFSGGVGGPLGKNHGHKVHAPGGFPVYSRQPGPKKQTQKSSYSMLDALFGIKYPKRKGR